MELEFKEYDGSEEHLNYIKTSIDRELSEPYPIFTYQFFLVNWPELAILAFSPEG